MMHYQSVGQLLVLIIGILLTGRAVGRGPSQGTSTTTVTTTTTTSPLSGELGDCRLTCSAICANLGRVCSDSIVEQLNTQENLCFEGIDLFYPEEYKKGGTVSKPLSSAPAGCYVQTSNKKKYLNTNFAGGPEGCDAAPCTNHNPPRSKFCVCEGEDVGNY